MISMSLIDVSCLVADSFKGIKYGNKYGHEYLFANLWQKRLDSSLHIYMSPHKDGTWYCKYSLTQYSQGAKPLDKEIFAFFDEDIRNFIKEAHELKSKYIDV